MNAKGIKARLRVFKIRKKNGYRHNPDIILEIPEKQSHRFLFAEFCVKFLTRRELSSIILAPYSSVSVTKQENEDG
jgi:hypothetical protein